MPTIPAQIVEAQEELARIGVGLAAFHQIAAGRASYPADIQDLALDVSTRGLRLGLFRASQLIEQIEVASAPPAGG
jgi:hypothetical protein